MSLLDTPGGLGHRAFYLPVMRMILSRSQQMVKMQRPESAPNGGVFRAFLFTAREVHRMSEQQTSRAVAWSISLPETMVEAIKAQARAERRPYSWIAKAAIEQYLNERQQEAKGEYS